MQAAGAAAEVEVAAAGRFYGLRIERNAAGVTRRRYEARCRGERRRVGPSILERATRSWRRFRQGRRQRRAVNSPRPLQG
jgi:hypothetical protein